MTDQQTDFTGHNQSDILSQEKSEDTNIWWTDLCVKKKKSPTALDRNNILAVVQPDKIPKRANEGIILVLSVLLEF